VSHDAGFAGFLLCVFSIEAVLQSRFNPVGDPLIWGGIVLPVYLLCGLIKLILIEISDLLGVWRLATRRERYETHTRACITNMHRCYQGRVSHRKNKPCSDKVPMLSVPVVVHTANPIRSLQPPRTCRGRCPVGLMSIGSWCRICEIRNTSIRHECLRFVRFQVY